MITRTDVEAIIAASYSEGSSHFGHLGLDLATFTQRIDTVVHKYLGSSPVEPAVIAFVTGLHGRDLYLATACAQYGPGVRNTIGTGDLTGEGGDAWKVFETIYKNHIRNLARFFHRDNFVAEDLAGNILADLYLPDRSGLSRIASYDGRSSLSTWLRVIVCNRAINARHSSNYNPGPQEAYLEIPDQPAFRMIELTVRARRYGPALTDSMTHTFQALTPRERLILLWRYENGLQLGQIGRLLGIHQSNVTRQIERIQKKLRDGVVASLSARHNLSASAIQECLEDIVDNPSHHISLLDLIKPSHQTLEKKSAQIQKKCGNSGDPQ